MNRFILAVVALLAVASLASAAERNRGQNLQRPNILFIFSDDHAPWATSMAGHPYAKTPNIDRIARQGAQLVNCFTPTPVCSPSRASLMTSRYGSEVGVTDWIHPRNETEHGLDPSLPTFPKLLADAGYATALIGKWHLGVPDRFHPTNFGFHYFMGFREGGTPPVDAVLEKDGKTEKIEGYIVEIVTDEAIDFLRRTPRDKPFLLCLQYREPHARWLPVRDEHWDLFKDLDPQIPNPDYPNLDTPRVKQMIREYLACIHAMDHQIGRVLAAVDELGLADNTLVIYSSDHGYNMGHNGIWHKGNGHWVLTEPPPATDNIPKGQRPNMYDHSLRLPTAIRWPGVIRPGTTIEQTVTLLDFLPTFAEVAGARLPAPIRGRSIVPLLRGQRVAWDNDLFTQYSTHHQSRTHMRALRTERWKLVRDFLNEGRDELYDLLSDPAESTNLINDPRPDVRRAIADLHARIIARMKLINDPALDLALKRN